MTFFFFFNRVSENNETFHIWFSGKSWIMPCKKHTWQKRTNKTHAQLGVSAFSQAEQYKERAASVGSTLAQQSCNRIFRRGWEALSPQPWHMEIFAQFWFCHIRPPLKILLNVSDWSVFLQDPENLNMLQHTSMSHKTSRFTMSGLFGLKRGYLALHFAWSGHIMRHTLSVIDATAALYTRPLTGWTKASAMFFYMQIKSP